MSIKGAFTGAVADKPGKVEMAAGGTLFLDEIQDISLVNQPRLMQFIEHRTFNRLGEMRERRVETRILLASNRELKPLVVSGDFRNDLYMRISAHQIHLPALKERLQDIPPIAEEILARECRDCGKNFNGFTPQAIYYLQSLDYPGNLRSLQGLIQRTVALTEYSLDRQQIDERDVYLAHSLEETVPASSAAGTTGFKARQEEFKRRMIIEALQLQDFNMTRTAEYLELGLDNLCHKVRKYRIDVQGLKEKSGRLRA